MSKFIGRRIVPKHDGVWDINKEYEELSIVLDKASGESYISRRPVPVGTAISDEIYWMQYSLYSAQIAEAVKEMEDTEARLIQYVDTAESNMNSRVNSAESLTNSNKAELNSRMDTLDKRLDANVSASTDKDKDYAAEVVDARVDEEGTKYGSVGSHIRAIGSGKGILKGAVNGSRLSFLDITPELVWTADKYISRKYGGLDNFSQGSNVYFATLDYIPFPYGGCWLQVYSAMSTVESDKSGIAFYDANKKFISGSDYNRETKKLAFRRIFCPDGTAYIRMSCMGQDNLNGVGIWLDDYRISVGHDLLGLNLSDNPLERIRNDAGLMTVFRHVGCIGDSLASGEAVYKKADGTTGGKDLFEYSWGQYLARMTGNTYYNWSKGGLRCDTFLSSSLATECFDGNHKCEAYIIGLGQNENNRKYKIGTVEDINLGDYTQNPDTYYGNYGKIIQKIQEMQPKAKIFILTDPLKSVENAGYNSAVREIAGIFKSVYLVDLYTYGTALYNSGFLYQQKRGGHYNAVGYFICAMIISTYIDWIMKKNPNEFREIEFIGLDNKFY